MSNRPDSEPFLVTKEHRRFVEFCDACRRYRYVGLCYGVPGVGKTLSARTYARWDRIEALSPQLLVGVPPVPEILACRTVFYTAPVSNSPHTIQQEVHARRRDLSTLVTAMRWVLDGVADYALTFQGPDLTELIIVDEADRLKPVGLEQVRDLYDRSAIGVVLIGMPGIEKRLARYPQLYSRVGFVHQFQPLSVEEMHFVLRHKWQQLGLAIDLSDFTDAEAVAAIIRITGGNFRLLQRLFSQIGRIMAINELRTLTREVVDAARELLVIGPTS